MTGPTYRLRDPTTQKWNKDLARAIDRGFNALVGEESPDEFVEPAVDRGQCLAGGRRFAPIGQNRKLKFVRRPS